MQCKSPGIRLAMAVTLLGFVLAAASGWQRTSGKTPGNYRVITLPLRPLSISNAGWVSGATYDQRAAVWSSERGIQVIGLPAQFNTSESTSINSQGGAVGTAFTLGSSRRLAFLFRHDKVVVLPGEQSSALAVNDAGDIVGQAKLTNMKAVGPVLWRKEVASDLHVCCSGTARSINGKGQIVGDTYDLQGDYHAFLWSPPQDFRRLETPEEKSSSAIAINDRGQVVVVSFPAGLFLFTDGKSEKLDLPASFPRGINNNGIIVGSFGSNPESQRAFIWERDRGRQDLNALIPQDSGWKLEVASSINDRGEVVGWGDHGDAENVGFLLIPVSDSR
jgi:probable HAF family extracellular repeat protein